jgi:hypothetical protein
MAVSHAVRVPGPITSRQHTALVVALKHKKGPIALLGHKITDTWVIAIVINQEAYIGSNNTVGIAVPGPWACCHRARCQPHFQPL